MVETTKYLEECKQPW